jgi:hypothetical protein
MNTRLHLDDLRQAWQAHDPGLADLITAVANQSDEPTDKPAREGAPTFQRFLREIRSPSFARRSKEEQAHFRVEQIKALEAPDAEAKLSDRLRLHEIILGLWNEDSLHARTVLLRVIADVPLRYGAWRALKRIFKDAEARGDTEIYGALAARFDFTYAGWQSYDPSRRTLAYLVRRAWRFLRHMGVRLPIEYPDAAVDVLVRYPDRTNWQRTWVANHIFYHETRKYNRGSFRLYPKPKSLLEHRAFADLWRRSPRPLFNLLERAQSDQARAFATEALRTDFRAVLREVEASWVARLVTVGSAAIDEFVVWILNNVPRFEQGAFRELGLHDAVLRLLESPSDKAREYAAGYARTHARDLPVAELVRLVDNDSKAVSKLALDLIGERHPRDEIGLEAWGWLLVTENGHDLAKRVLRQHFGAAELTPDWFRQHLFTEHESAFEFLTELLLQVHPLPQLGPGFFVQLIDAIKSDSDPGAYSVASFAMEKLATFDVNTLDREALQRLFLCPLTRDDAEGWVGEGRLQMRTLPVTFWKMLAYRPAWDADPWLAQLRQDGRKWTHDLDFDESLAETVLGWLSDPRHFPPAELGFDWLMQLVDSSEEMYHNFAVETIIKGFVPADFAPQAAQPAAAPTAPATVDLSNLSFLFTGKMATMQRKDAESKVKAAGGTMAGSVTKKLCYLVVGDEGSPLFSGGQKGDKQTKAEQLNAAGANIRIISEAAFLQMLSGGVREAASEDQVRAGCERLWQMALAPGTAELRRAELARQYILRHHPEIGPSQTGRPVDPGAEIPLTFLTFERVAPLLHESRKPLRDFALELARWELARWNPPAEELLTLSELPHTEVRHFVAQALLAEDLPENRRFRINPDSLTPAAVYRFCESADAETRKLGMQLIQRSPRLRVPEELFRLTESPDRLVRNFVVRELWALYRDRGVTPDWKPPVPPAATVGAAARKAAATPEPRGPGVPHRPEQLPAEKPSLAAFLRRALFEIPPGRPEGGPAVVPGDAQQQQAGRRLKPLPARKAKLSLVEVMRDLALEDDAFARGILPLLEEFMTSRGVSERAACLVAITRIRHHHPALKNANGAAR